MSLPDPASKPLLTVDEARRALGDVVGRTSFYMALNSGEIPGVRRVGRRLFVVTAELRTWLKIDGPGANGARPNCERDKQ